MRSGVREDVSEDPTEGDRCRKRRASAIRGGGAEQDPSNRRRVRLAAEEREPMSLREKFAQLIDAAQSSVAYWRDIAITDFTRDLHARVRHKRLTHADLAVRMGTSRPYVTRLLNGGNFTLETMVKLAMALDGVIRIHIADREAVTTHWKDEFMNHAQPAVESMDLENPQRFSFGSSYAEPLKAPGPEGIVFSSNLRAASTLTALGPLEERRSQELFESPKTREALAV
jgi:transcriptional regulator with XRE-family HTH domain